MAGAGYRVFSAGAVLTAAQVNTFLMEQSVMNFAGTAARGSALASVLSAGQMAHVGGGTVTVYDGSAWQQVYPTVSSPGLAFVAGTAFSAVASVSVNSCFTSTYDNYRIIFTGQSSGNDITQNMRLRVSGADSSALTYNHQALEAGSTTLTGSRSTSVAQWTVGGVDDDDDANVTVIEVFRPNLATRTSFISQCIYTVLGSRSIYMGGYFDNSTVFDGFTLYPASGTFTGTVRIYGYRNS